MTGIQPYGAFVSLDNETQGLIHVSEVQSGYTKNIHSLLKVGQPVTVQIIDIDEYSKNQFIFKNVRKTNPAVPYRRKGISRIKIVRSDLPLLRSSYLFG